MRGAPGVTHEAEGLLLRGGGGGPSCRFPGLILNSTLHSQIFEFDYYYISIQILIWIFGSTYRKGEILKQK